MYWWAKLTSLVIMGYLIHTIYIIVEFFLLPIKKPWWIYTLPYWLFSGLVFYSPFFYYGWVKTPKSKEMKYFTKFMTIAFSICVVFISPIYNGLSDYYMTIPALALIIPLYYFAWRKPKI